MISLDQSCDFVQTRLNLETEAEHRYQFLAEKKPLKNLPDGLKCVRYTSSNQKRHLRITTSKTKVLTLSSSFSFGARPLDILIHNNRNSSGRCRIKHLLSLSSKSGRHKNLGNLKTNIILTSICIYIFGLLFSFI